MDTTPDVFVIPVDGGAPAKRLTENLPNAKALDVAYRWLEEGLPARQKFARGFPASKVERSSAFGRADFAQALAAEAKERTGNARTMYSGLMQYKGILDRWPDLPEAQSAKTILLKAEEANPKGRSCQGL